MNVTTYEMELDRLSAVIAELEKIGVKASMEDTGGGIVCLCVTGKRFWYFWGTANETWGADVNEHEGDSLVDSINLDIRCDSTDYAEVARQIAKESI